MKEVEYYCVTDWYGNCTEKILDIKNMELFMEYVRMYESYFINSRRSDSFYENEIEVIKKNLEWEKKELSILPQKIKHGEISAYDFKLYKELHEKNIKKLEELLKKYEGV